MPTVLKKFNIQTFFLLLLASPRDTEPLEEARDMPDSGLKGSPHHEEFCWVKNAEVYFTC